MRARTSASLVLSFALPLVAVLGAVGLACSGKTADAGPQDASTGDAAPRPADCPQTAPLDGAACAHEQLLCEYGDDYDPRCNTVSVCSGGRWGKRGSFGGAPQCPSVPPTVPPNPSECPATRSAVPAGTICTGSAACAYPGSSCFCGRYCPSYPVRMPDCDAGVSGPNCCSTQVQWNCFDGPTYCPIPRPRVGSACAKEGDSCAIDGPVECGQTTLDCRQGVWNLQSFGCPVSTVHAKRDIVYVEREGEERLRKELTGVRLATYRYKEGDAARHLGFIIEDMPPGSPAVLASRDRVDLYGYMSMAVASLKAQEREIAQLKEQMARIEARCAR